MLNVNVGLDSMGNENPHNKRYRLIMEGYFKDWFSVEAVWTSRRQAAATRKPAPPWTTSSSNTVRQLLTKRKNRPSQRFAPRWPAGTTLDNCLLSETSRRAKSTCAAAGLFLSIKVDNRIHWLERGGPVVYFERHSDTNVDHRQMTRCP